MPLRDQKMRGVKPLEISPAIAHDINIPTSDDQLTPAHWSPGTD
jgi:hypothetical protein